ncbi:MAG: hypothetical protein ACLFMN_00350 [Desulfobacterales bacterium]
MRRNPYSGQELLQLIWGIALAVMGVAFFFRIPWIMGRVEEMNYLASAQVFLRFAFYLIAVILLSGGIQKIYRFMRIRGKAG